VPEIKKLHDFLAINRINFNGTTENSSLSIGTLITHLL